MASAAAAAPLKQLAAISTAYPAACLKFMECSWYLGVSGNDRKAIPSARVDAVRQSADILVAKAHFGVKRFSNIDVRTAPSLFSENKLVCGKYCALFG
jgi:hypothetical protein